MEIQEKRKKLHANYKLNFQRFKKARENDYQIEALIIMESMFEHLTNIFIIRLSSLSKNNKEHFSKLLKPYKRDRKFATLMKKVEWIIEFIDNNNLKNTHMIEKTKEKEELIEAFKTIQEEQDLRNEIVHRIMFSNKTYEEICVTNKKLIESRKRISKYAARLNNYIKTKTKLEDVNEIVSILEKELHISKNS